MNKISVGDALGAGFRLIAREPAAFAVWCLGYFLVGAIPAALMWPDVSSMYAAMGEGTDFLTDPQFLAAQRRMAVIQPLSMLTGLAVFVGIPSAATRAVLFPDDRRFFYLRVSMRELWFGLATIVVFLAWFAATFAAFIPLLLVVGVGAAVGQAGAGIAALLMLVLIPAVFGVGIWLFLRMSMAPVMSFAEREFRLPESWKLTRGHAWRLFLVGLVLTILVFALEFAALGLLIGAAGGFANVGATMSRVTLPIMLAFTAVASVVIVGLYVIGAAAWASAYRQLRPNLDDTFA